MDNQKRLDIIESSSKQVSRGIFFSTIIIVTSFLPVFLLTGQEGKLFHPLAWTKSFILIIDALLAVTLAPVLISFFLKGKFKTEEQNPLNRLLERVYAPMLHWVMRWRKTTLAINVLALLVSIPLIMSLGTEFMPPLNEGSILFMPVAQPDVSNTEMKRILQVQDKIIKQVPEVLSVLGKAGRASSATDNSPINMIETIILLKPREQWREGMTKAKLIEEMNGKLQIPGVVNGWTQPIINRINMLSTGIRTDVGVKVYGQNLNTINDVANQVNAALKGVPGVEDLYVEPVTGGKYLEIDMNRPELARYGLTVDQVNEVVESAIGGAPVASTVEGRRRFAINVRLAQDYRNSLADIKRIPIQTAGYGPVPLSAVTSIRYAEGPPMISSENAQLRGAVLFNVRGRDLGSTVDAAMQKLQSLESRLPQGYYLEWSGQYENLISSQRTLKLILPLVLVVMKQK